MGIAYIIAAIVLPALLLATIIYVWQQNRKEGAEAVRKADRGARKLQHEDADNPASDHRPTPHDHDRVP